MNIETRKLERLVVSKDVCDREDQERAAQLGVTSLQCRHDPDANKESYRLNRPSGRILPDFILLIISHGRQLTQQNRGRCEQGPNHTEGRDLQLRSDRPCRMHKHNCDVGEERCGAKIKGNGTD